MTIPKTLGAFALSLLVALAPSGAFAAGAVSGQVNVNTAGVEQLAELPGIGQTKAAAIVALREERGRFRSVDELLEVKGIGEKALARIRPYLTLSGRTDIVRE
jgi:comEA protein